MATASAALSPAFTAHFKVVLTGEAGVGKTSMFRHLEAVHKDADWSKSDRDFCTYKTKIDGSCIELGVWDTAGVEVYRSITRNYYRGSRVVVYVYREDSLSSLNGLANHVKSARFQAKDAHSILVGTACTKVVTGDESKKKWESSDTVVSDEKVKKFAQEFDFPPETIHLVDLSTPDSVVNIFQQIAEMLAEEGAGTVPTDEERFKISEKKPTAPANTSCLC